MAQESVFREVIGFFGDLGIYDVVLPFLLVFAIVFSILEKTKVLGTEKIDGKDYTKKNLNSIVAFVIAFLVVASTNLVSVINTALANTVLILLLIVSYMLLVGVFFEEGKGVFLEKGGLRTFFMITIFVGIVLIFMDALDWLRPMWDHLIRHWESRWIGSLILLVIILFFMWFITKPQGSEKPKKEEK